MRIWFLTTELADEVAGGIARYLDNFVPLVGAAGHEAVIIARSKRDRDEEIAPRIRLIGVVPRCERQHGDVPQEACVSDAHQAYPYNLISFAPALSYEMADRVLGLLDELPAPDIIETHEYAALPYFLLQRKLTQRSKLDRIPILVHMHGPLYELMPANQEPRYRFPDYWTGEMEKFCVRAADAVLTPSEFLADRTRRILKLPEAIEHIPYPTALADAQTQEEPTPGEVLFVGRLQILKGVLPLLEGCVRLWSQGENFRLTLIGSDTRFTPRNSGMREYIERRYAPWIAQGKLVLTGPMPHADVQKRMCTAWTVVVPSTWENFPNVCIEAMNAGQVVLASRSGGQAEMAAPHGENGFIFDWSSPGDFEEKLKEVLNLPPERRKFIGEQARQHIQRMCDPAHVLERRIAHYQRVIEKYAPRELFPTHPAESEPHSAPRLCPRPSTDEVPGLLSVIIPFYNLGEFVGETIDSILSSTYTNREIVLVNDGSTDPASLEKLRELEENPPAGLRVVHTTNQGLASARNNGADAARGEFICFLDADDCAEPTYFERAIDVLTRYPNVDFVYSWVRYFGRESAIWPTWNAEFPYLLGHNMLTAFTVQRRQSFLRWGRNKPDVAYALEDFEMWINMLEAGCVGVCLPDPLVRYRVRPNSMLQSSSSDQQLYLYDLITQAHPRLYQQWGVELFNLQNANGPGHRWNHPAMPPCEPPDAAIARLTGEVKHFVAAWEEQRCLLSEQRDYIQVLESDRDRLWAEVQRLGKAWQTQKDFIHELEGVRDKLWQELQEAMGKSPVNESNA